MKPVKWIVFFCEEHLFMEGKGDDVFHVIPNRRYEDGNSHAQILSKKAMVEFVEKLGGKEDGQNA